MWHLLRAIIGLKDQRRAIGQVDPKHCRRAAMKVPDPINPRQAQFGEDGRKFSGINH